MAKPDNNITFSAREMEVLALAWQCMETQPKLDIKKLADLTGYTPGSASVTFGNIKRKIKLLGESLAANGPTMPATPKKPGTPARSKSATPKSTGKRSAAAAKGTPSKRQKESLRQREESVGDDEELTRLFVKEETIDEDQSGVERNERALLDGMQTFADH